MTLSALAPRHAANSCGTSAPARAPSGSNGCWPTPPTAVAVEDATRAARIARNLNAATLGTGPDFAWCRARRPQALRGLPAPDAVFIGGSATAPGVLDAALRRRYAPAAGSWSTASPSRRRVS